MTIVARTVALVCLLCATAIFAPVFYMPVRNTWSLLPPDVLSHFEHDLMVLSERLSYASPALVLVALAVLLLKEGRG